MPCYAMTRKTVPPMWGTPDGMTWMPGRFIAFVDITRPWPGKAADPITCPSYIMEITDAEKEEAEALFTQPRFTDDDTENLRVTVEVNLARLPRGIRRSLRTTGTARVTLGQLRRVAKNNEAGRRGF